MPKHTLQLKLQFLDIGLFGVDLHLQSSHLTRHLLYGHLYRRHVDILARRHWDPLLHIRKRLGGYRNQRNIKLLRYAGSHKII